MKKEVLEGRAKEGLLEAELEKVRVDHEQRVNEYEDLLNGKIRDNQSLTDANSKFKHKVE